jgi:hypothetical protein
VKITAKFDDITGMSAKDIEKLSAELAEVQDQLESKEMRWLELSELMEG